MTNFLPGKYNVYDGGFVNGQKQKTSNFEFSILTNLSLSGTIIVEIKIMAKNVKVSSLRSDVKVEFDPDFLVGQQNRMKEILRRAGSDALDTEAVVPITVTSKFSHLCLIPLYDLHMFGEGFNLKRFQMVADYLKNTPNAYSFIGGDWYDNANVLSKTNPYNSKTNVTQAIDGSEELLESIKHKILFVLGGNHDGEFGDRVKPANISPAKESAKKIAPYVPYNALLDIKFEGNPNFGLKAFATHGSMAKSVDELAKKCVKLCKMSNVFPDMIFSGHIHTELTFIKPISVPVKNKKGIITGYKNKNVRIEILPSFQGDNQYSASKGFNDGYTNAIAFDITCQKNPYYTAKTSDTEFEYILKITKFPILKKFSDEYTSFAKRYLSAYKVASDQELRASLQTKMESEQMQSSINSIVETLNQIEREI